MNDEEFEALLRDAASTYNTPHAPPREVMWDAIATARSSAAIVPIHSARRVPRWVASVVGAAAVLVIGIAIGRQSRGARVPQAPAASIGQPVRANTSSPSVPTPELAQSAGATPQSGPAPRANARTSNSRRGDDQEQALVRRVGAQARRAGEMVPGASGNESINDVDAYRLAVVEHLTRTEVLLTGFRAEARSGKPTRLDAQFAAASRELLGTTRLLLATRRGEDPAITRLLQDLEFVLMQLSQYANDGRGIDLDAINQSIDRRNVLPKLRYSIPAGISSSAGT